LASEQAPFQDATTAFVITRAGRKILLFVADGGED
jgi:hypothetical protein